MSEAIKEYLVKYVPVSQIRLNAGTSLWELDMVSLELKKAQPEDITFQEKVVSVIRINLGCRYVKAINLKNAQRKLLNLILVK